MTPSTDHTARVRRYYDNNQAAFERLGQGGTSIHRAVWGPGVSRREDAFHHVDELMPWVVGLEARHAAVVYVGAPDPDGVGYPDLVENGADAAPGGHEAIRRAK